MTVIQSRGRLEQLGPVISEATAGIGIDPDEALWSVLGASRRDLSGVTLDRAQQVAFELFQRNPLGHRLTTLTRDFVVGDGITYAVANPFVADVVEEFWGDSVNDLGQRVHDFAIELGLFGELAPEAFTGDVSGFVRLGYIDSAQIKRVTAVEGNPLVLDQVVIREKGFGVRGRPLNIIRDRGNGVLEGDVFYFRVNAMSNATRGWPDMLHIADWLDAYDQLLWEMIERARLARTFIWDVEIEGEQPAVDEWLRRNGTPPKSGSIRAHNNGVQWKAVAPQLDSYETAKESEVINQHLAAGSGFPKHWLSASADVNRATAQEMGAPTIRQLQRRQDYFLNCLRTMARYAIEQAVDRGVIVTDEFGKVPVYDDEGNETDQTQVPWKLVRLSAPEISPRESTRAMQLLPQLATGLATAESKGWFGASTSRRALAAFFAQMGVDFDPLAASVEATDNPTDAPAPPAVEGVNASG